jgi:putative membrane protein (TIGR04086 family)
VEGLRWEAIWRAGLSMAFLLLPIGIVMEALELSDAAALPFFLVIMVIAAVGGFGAAKLAPERPLPNGAAAAAFGYAIVQGIGVVRHLIAGEDSSFVTYAFLALLMATCGMLGAMLERRTRVMR